MSVDEFVSMIEGHLRQIEHAANAAGDVDLTDNVEYKRAAAAMYLHNIYSGIEKVLLRFLRQYSIAAPTGLDWHLRLIELFHESGNPPLPALFDDAMRPYAHLLRGLRHAILNNYVTDLDPVRLTDHVKAFPQWLSAWVARVRQVLSTV